MTAEIVAVLAAGCRRCSSVATGIRELAARHGPDVPVTLLDAAVEPDRARALGVAAVPTLVLLADGGEVARLTGVHDPETLEAFFAAAAAGEVPSGTTRLPAGERYLRLATAATLSLVAALTDQPILWATAALVLASALWDHRRRSRP